MGDRLSLDLDFYVTRFDQDLFDRAETATLAALRERGYQAEVGHRDTWLRQVIVTDPATGEQVVLDLGQDYRQHPPIITGLGPVIDLPDAAASKARALNDRRAARDYLDIHALFTQPGWTPARLFTALRDNLRPVLTVDEFAADLAAAGDQDPEDYHAYGLANADITHLADDFTGSTAVPERCLAGPRLPNRQTRHGAMRPTPLRRSLKSAWKPARRRGVVGSWGRIQAG